MGDKNPKKMNKKKKSVEKVSEEVKVVAEPEIIKKLKKQK